jgi:steroid delta-isomerase-like uncharacterized protein
MNALEVSKRFTDAWNRHDADALVALFAEGGTYHNPRIDHALTGKAIADFAKSVWAAYPDMSLEIVSRGDTGGGLVATQWVLHGTHTGPFMDGTPPTGRTVAIRGLPSLRLRAIRSARSTHTLTAKR